MKILSLEQSGSTNDDAFEQLTRLDACVVWTLNQTAGRGSRGRHWLAPKNNVLAVSIGLGPGVGPSPTEFCYPLFAGVLLIDSLRLLAPKANLTLKWPNDLLLNGSKLAGILCESRIIGDQPKIVIGMGVNLRRHASLEDLPKGYAALDQLGEPPAAEALVEALVDRFHTTLSMTANPAALNKLWLERHFIEPGVRVSLTAYGEQINGQFIGLSRDGGFLLRGDSGKVHTVRASCDDFSLAPPD